MNKGSKQMSKRPYEKILNFSISQDNAKTNFLSL